MAREIGQRVKGLENEQGLLWDEVRALRDRITRGWGATLKVILRPPGNVSIADGRVVAPETSGQANLGTPSLPFGVVYANSFTNPTGEVVATEITDRDGGANIRAARSATVDMLLALDGSAKFPASTVTLASPSGLSLAGGLQLDDGVAGAGLIVSTKVLAVGAGAGIDVTADAVAVDVSADFTWTGDHTFVGFVLAQTEGAACGYLSYRYSDDAAGPYWSSRKARGSIASPAIVSDSDGLWNLTVMGHDGAGWIPAAGIGIRVDGTPGIDDMPGEILFRTTPDGSDTLQNRVRIRSTGVTEFYNGLTLGGATGVNVITVPDNVAQAAHLVDAGGTEYMRVVTTNTQPTIVFNEGGADVDVRVAASGAANALCVEGSTGNVSLGTNTPSADAILELFSTTKAFLLTRMTTTQRDALTAVDGMALYNSITGEMNFRENGAWAVSVHTTRQVIAGDGLTGGGALSSDVTLNVGAGSGIDVAADSIAVDVSDFIDTAYGLTESANNIRINAGAGLEFASGALRVDVDASFTWTGTHTFQSDVQMNCNLDFDGGGRSVTTSSGDLTLAPGGVCRIDSITYVNYQASFFDDIRIAGGLYVGGTGVAPDLGDICYTSDLRPFRTGTLYTSYTLVPLAVPLTSTSWDGDAYSDVGTSTQLDLNTVFGAPVGIKAVLIQMIARDSAGWGTGGLYFACGPSSAQWGAAAVRPMGGDVEVGQVAVVPCDANGDVWYRINASGAGTMDIWLRIWGYCI